MTMFLSSLPRSVPARWRRRALALAMGMLSGAAASAEPVDAHEDHEDHEELSLPSWVLGDHRCSYTMISSQVALTTLACGATAMFPVDGPARTFTQRRTNRTARGDVVVTRKALATLPPAGLALVRFKAADPFGTTGAPLASYAEDDVLLRDPVQPNAARVDGTQFYIHGKHYVDSYPLGAGAVPERRYDALKYPLVYRSLARLRKDEPVRFQRYPATAAKLDWDDLLGEQVTEHLRGHAPARRDELAIILAGTLGDALTHRRRPPPLPGWSTRLLPFQPFEAGAGLMASPMRRPNGLNFAPYRRLVGLVSGESPLHMRLSAHWPVVYRVLLAEGLAADARHVARQVLPMRDLPADRRGTVGAFYGQENPSTGALEFYRLRRVEADGTYPAPPSHGQDDHWWEHFGTALPSRQQALAGADPVTPLPGSAP